MTRPLTKLANEIRRAIRLNEVPFEEVERGKCETCGADVGVGTGPFSPRRFVRVKLSEPSKNDPLGPREGLITRGKKRCALCTARDIGDEK